MTLALLAFAMALLTSLGLTAPVRKLALRIGMVDRPGPRKVHSQPIPLMGGLAIYAGVSIAFIIFCRGQAIAEIAAILAGATLVVLVGTLDDRGLLHHQIKLFVGMPLAGLILLAAGIRAHVFSVFFPGSAATLADAALTVFWVTGITASFSILDYMDGLCAGIAAMASLFFAIFAIQEGQILVSVLAAAVLGATLGFLRWNFNPAKIFMGDGGAMLLGFLMATLALKLRLSGVSRAAGWLVPLFVLGAPIFDTLLVSISRARRGLLPFASPGKDHTGHRLANCGLGTRGAVMSMYALGGIGGLVALLVSRLASWTAIAVAAIAIMVSLVAVAALERAPYERQPSPSPSKPSPSKPSKLPA